MHGRERKVFCDSGTLVAWMNPSHHMTTSPTSSPLVYFRAVDREVTIIGESLVWEGFQAEIDFFQFHADRLAKFLESDTHSGLCYHSDGSSYAYSPGKNAGESNGVYSASCLPLRDLLNELI